MSYSSDFIIENSILTKYVGPGGSVDIPEGVTAIGGYFDRVFVGAFQGCSGIMCVTIPNSVTIIGWKAFYGCVDLVNVVIPDSVTHIGNEAFLGCRSLTSLMIPASVSVIDGDAFSGCSSMERIEFKSGAITFGYSPFERCDKLSVFLSEGVAQTSKKLAAPLAKACWNINEEDLAWVLLFQSAKSWKTEGLAAAKEKDPIKVFSVQLGLLSELKKISLTTASNALDVCLAFSRELPQELVLRFATLLEERNCERQLSALKESFAI